MSGLPSRAEMSRFLLRFIQNRRHRDAIDILPAYAWEFRVLGGLIERVRRSARAYIALETRGFAAEGRILVRGALEHALTAQWAHLTAGGLSRLEVAMLTTRLAFARSATLRAEDPHWNDLLVVLDKRIPRSQVNPADKLPSLPKFTGPQGIMAELNHDGYFQRAYVVLSRVNHVTDQAAEDFILEDGGILGVANEPQSGFEDDVFHTLATACCLVAWIEARLEGNDAEVKWAQSQRLLWRLDTRLPAERRRFADEDG
jgi:hypothetical protein